MEFDFKNNYPEGSVMNDYINAVEDDTFHTGLRDVYQASHELDRNDGSDIDPKAKHALNNAITELHAAMGVQAEFILRRTAEEHAERAADTDSEQQH